KGIDLNGTPLWRLGYLSNYWLTTAASLLPLLIAAAIVQVIRKRSSLEPSRLYICFMISAAAIVLFNFLTMKGLTYSLFLSFPILFEFRSPVKLTYDLAFLVSPLLALGATVLGRLIHKTIRSNTV